MRIMKEFDDQVVDNALEQMQKDFDNHIRDLKDDDDQTMAENLYEWFSEKYVSPFFGGEGCSWIRGVNFSFEGRTGFGIF